jgi:hypothetical protein
MWLVVASEFFKVRVSPDVKRRVAAAADSKFLTESAWLRALVLRELASVEGEDVERIPIAAEVTSGAHGKLSTESACLNRVHIRLNADDRLLLDARAEARGMRPATYVSVLTRSHLRRLAPLPKDELLALRSCIGQLAAIGRNINQIAKAANTGGQLPGSVREEFRAMLSVCEALRDHNKALLKANLASWKAGW